MSAERESGLRFVPTAGATLILILVTATAPQLSQLALGIAAAATIASAVAASVIKRPDRRTRASMSFAVFAVTAAGQTRGGAPFVVATTVFLIASLAAARAAQAPAELRVRRGDATLSPARRRATVVILFVTAVVGATLGALLPPASAWAERQAERYFGARVAAANATGFGTRMRIGDLHGMLVSDRVVMRVHGAPVDYLRGAVLDQYDRRIWTSTLEEGDVVADRADAPEEEMTTRIVTARAARVRYGATEGRWFLPAGACALHTRSGRIKRDPHGVARPDPPNDLREISLRGGPGCAPAIPPAPPPGATDLAMAAKIRAEIEPVARAWTSGVTGDAPGDDAEKLSAIERGFSSFTYSLADRREGNVDPVVEFLTTTREGHCELFATAMALMARTQGIPARVAVGYRVTEVNHLTGYAVVRERNAHAWVEAWVDGAWRAYDPTPASETFASEGRSRWDEALDAVAWNWERTAAAIARLTLLDVGVGSGAVAVVLLVIRQIGLRRSRGRGAAAVAGSQALPAFTALAAALEERGLSRRPSEPLERFAARVARSTGDRGRTNDERATGEAWAHDAAEVIRSYAALRYGGVGDEEDTSRRLQAAARRVSARAALTPS